jgi:hypothetical protein
MIIGNFRIANRRPGPNMHVYAGNSRSISAVFCPGNCGFSPRLFWIARQFDIDKINNQDFGHEK